MIYALKSKPISSPLNPLPHDDPAKWPRFEPSAGVVGFTIGTLREMYPEGIPDWLASQFEGDIAMADNCKGVWL